MEMGSLAVESYRGKKIISRNRKRKFRDLHYLKRAEMFGILFPPKRVKKICDLHSKRFVIAEAGV